jgi:NOL1/NOP2/fmu family ribosome biogenesis protein
MRIYKIEMNETDYDEFSSFVIRAANKERAVELAKDVGSAQWDNGYTIKQIEDYGEEEVILTYYCAG